MLKKYFPFFLSSFFPFVFFLLFFLLSIEWASAQVIKMPKPLPNFVKEYKSVTLLAGLLDMLDTGVRVRGGDFVTIVADGEMSLKNGWGSQTIYAPDRLIFKIGKKGKGRDLNQEESFEVAEEGNLYLDYIPLIPTSVHLRDTGFFRIDIIVWKEYDPVVVANFLEEASLKDPKNKILKDLAQRSKQNKEIFLAEEKAKKEVEETKKAIVTLKGKEIPGLKETPEKKAVSELSERDLREEAKQAIQTVKEKGAIGIKDPEKEKQTAELTDKLQKALQALKELDEMKKQLAEQKEKMARLEQTEAGKSKQSKIPPVIAIASPKDGTSVDFEYISIAGVAESEKGIANFEILVNQKPASQKDQRGLQLIAKDLKQVDFSEKIHLREGKNEISVVIQDTEGMEAKKTISIQFAKKKMEVWAVVIGISKYKNIPSLKYAANDAREFYRYLTEVNGVPKDHIWLILDEEANMDNLRSILGTQLRRQAGKDDMVIIYLAGHGATERDAASLDGDGLEKYILPYNANPKDLYASALPMNEVSRIFQRISSEKIVFISDTCYSGASGGRTIPVIGTRTTISGSFFGSSFPRERPGDYYGQRCQ